MFDNVIVFGCSYSYGSGFIEDSNTNHTSEPVFYSDKLKTYFKECDTWDKAFQRLKEITYGGYIAKKYNAKYYNYAMAGIGIEEMNRRAFSVFTRKQFTKNTLVIYQLPNYNRIELIDCNQIPSSPGQIPRHTHMPKDFMLNCFETDSYLGRLLSQYSTTTQWIKSFGYTVIPFSIENKYFWNYQNHSEEFMQKDLFLIGQNKPHDIAYFPSIKKIKDEIGLIDFDFWKRTPELPTFHSEGIWEDYHWTKEGHDIIGDTIYNYLNNLLKN
jgi:hypothetical protein